ncbi:M15 family metallopeptidase [Tenacibaculum aestuarii]|uniref:M15 family metallopeptidase n=1 Tax=Tenacibaculum aestuarii TaxID=362781 RepID=UPI0038952E00
MVTSKQCIQKYGEPNVQMEYKHMVLWDVPDWINKELPVIPNKIYCNKDLVKPLQQAFENIIKRGLQKELKTWDGCFNIRKKRGLKSWSLHSWAIAIDINAAWNGLGKQPLMSLALVKCFTDAGFDWGGTWTRKDGMHFQLKQL